MTYIEERLNTIANALETHSELLAERRNIANASVSIGKAAEELRKLATEPNREVFRVLFLNNQHQLLADEVMFMGTIDSSPVYPRVVVQKALEHNAAALILSHNHPSGEPEPSRADRSITERLQQALALVDINVLDHIVVGDCFTVSFAERGWM